MDTYFITYCSGRLSGILGSKMCQDEFDLNEIKCQDVY